MDPNFVLYCKSLCHKTGVTSSQTKCGDLVQILPLSFLPELWSLLFVKNPYVCELRRRSHRIDLRRTLVPCESQPA